MRLPAKKIGTHVIVAKQIFKRVGGDKGREGVGSEDAEDAGKQERINGWHPRGGAGVYAEGRTKSCAYGEGMRDVPGLE